MSKEMKNNTRHPELDSGSNIPKLRFPEFLDDREWEEKKLADNANTLSGYAFKSDFFVENGKKLVTPKNFTKYGYGNFSNNFSKYTSEECDTKYICNEGDLLILLTDLTPSCELLGKPLLLKKKDGSVLLNQRIIKIDTNQNLCKTFLFYFFLTDQYHERIVSTATGSTVRHSSNKILLETMFPIPPSTKEQQKIADCLSSVDNLITAQSKKVETLKEHKKALMQQLFPQDGEEVPKLRFPEFKNAPKWEEKTLIDISDFINQKISLDKLTLNNYISTENLLQDFSGVTISSKLPDVKTVTHFKENDILISNIRPYLKKVWSATFNGGASNDVIVVRAKENTNNNFLTYVLKNEEFINYVMQGAKGVKMPRGDIALIKKYPLFISSEPKEQQKIANFLSSIDELITSSTKKVETLKEHKKALMQQLFPSKEVKI